MFNYRKADIYHAATAHVLYEPMGWSRCCDLDKPSKSRNLSKSLLCSTLYYLSAGFLWAILTHVCYLMYSVLLTHGDRLSSKRNDTSQPASQPATQDTWELFSDSKGKEVNAVICKH